MKLYFTGTTHMYGPTFGWKHNDLMVGLKGDMKV